MGGSGPEYRSAVFAHFDSGLAAAIICPVTDTFFPEEKLLEWFALYKQSSITSA